MSPDLAKRACALAVLFIAATSSSDAQEAEIDAAPADPQYLATAIEGDVALIRGLSFKHPVGVETQSSELFAKYVAGRIDEEVPPAIRDHYGKIVRTLGLYRGPLIGDFSAMMTSVMVSQAGAYYDPQKQRFYVLMTKMPELMRGALYAHELYHAMQDQHFGLAQYLNMNGDKPSLDSDHMLARQAVVEGEATYMMTLWILQKSLQSIPSRELLEPIVAAQTNLGMDQIRGMLQQPQMAELIGKDLQGAMQSAEKIPAFILDEMVNSYLKGMGFVFAIQEQGWPSVAKLYTGYPPQSTEHILHPQKWLTREKVVAIEWPDFGKVSVLKPWVLLDSDVLGEFRWRTVFKEYGFADVAESVAAGWGGDRYAVFKRKDSDAMLLLLRTSWDSKADATQFFEAYRRVLAVKYADKRTATRLVQDGVNVFAVEGGDEASIESLLKVVEAARSSTL